TSKRSTAGDDSEMADSAIPSPLLPLSKIASMTRANKGFDPSLGGVAPPGAADATLRTIMGAGDGTRKGALGTPPASAARTRIRPNTCGCAPPHPDVSATGTLRSSAGAVVCSLAL